jgi:hypothetical protein
MKNRTLAPHPQAPELPLPDAPPYVDQIAPSVSHRVVSKDEKARKRAAVAVWLQVNEEGKR